MWGTRAFESQFELGCAQPALCFRDVSHNVDHDQAALLGLDLRRHAEFGLRPGEVRTVELAPEAPPDFSGSISCAQPPSCPVIYFWVCVFRPGCFGTNG